MQKNVQPGDLSGEAFIPWLIAVVEALLFRAGDAASRSQAQRVLEALRQSDTMVHGELCRLEGEMAGRMDRFVRLVEAGDGEAAAVAEELLVLLAGRNNRCKQL